MPDKSCQRKSTSLNVRPVIQARISIGVGRMTVEARVQKRISRMILFMQAVWSCIDGF